MHSEPQVPPCENAHKTQGAASGAGPGRRAGAKASGRAQPRRTPPRKAARPTTGVMDRDKGAEGGPVLFTVLPCSVRKSRVKSGPVQDSQPLQPLWTVPALAKDVTTATPEAPPLSARVAGNAHLAGCHWRSADAPGTDFWVREFVPGVQLGEGSFPVRPGSGRKVGGGNGVPECQRSS